ncbi:xanthine dehydrogenase small subunit [Shewanella sp.]|uniref:xanthine dehydrogenase small subunit n=1 Tax=Shewanella sp. TaxID=50422 RepID=UPI003A985D3B
MLELMINSEVVREEHLAPDTMLLNYLRDSKGLRGTKEGCGSGDCGACTVVIADMDTQGELRYRQINACITPIHALHGKQVITVEHLQQGSQLHPVQQIVVEQHGTQCGFCTPGFVMSLYALFKQKHKPANPVSYLSGNLCRCTGYGPLINAAKQVAATSNAAASADEPQLKQWLSRVPRADDPHYLKPLNRQELAAAKQRLPQAWLIAGGTDLSLVFTQKYQSASALIDVSQVDDLLQISATEKGWRLGAAVTLAQVHEFMQQHYPSTSELFERLGSLTIRHRGTLGGSLGNASPIGDIAPLVISLGGQVELDDGQQRELYAIEDFITGYRQTCLRPEQWISAIHLPKLSAQQTHAAYKVSKRAEDDISTVVLALSVTQDSAGVINACHIGAGGVAATPVRLGALEQLLIGQRLSQAVIEQVKQQVPHLLKPMSDVRGSAQYRLQLVQNLFQRFYMEYNNIETRVVTHA